VFHEFQDTWLSFFERVDRSVLVTEPAFLRGCHLLRRSLLRHGLPFPHRDTHDDGPFQPMSPSKRHASFRYDGGGGGRGGGGGGVADDGDDMEQAAEGFSADISPVVRRGADSKFTPPPPLPGQKRGSSSLELTTGDRKKSNNPRNGHMAASYGTVDSFLNSHSEASSDDAGCDFGGSHSPSNPLDNNGLADALPLKCKAWVELLTRLDIVPHCLSISEANIVFLRVVQGGSEAARSKDRARGSTGASALSQVRGSSPPPPPPKRKRQHYGKGDPSSSTIIVAGGTELHEYQESEYQFWWQSSLEEEATTTTTVGGGGGTNKTGRVGGVTVPRTSHRAAASSAAAFGAATSAASSPDHRRDQQHSYPWLVLRDATQSHLRQNRNLHRHAATSSSSGPWAGNPNP
jgi:hypothetical protein